MKDKAKTDKAKELLPQACELLDNAVIAIEGGDITMMEQAAGAGREFLDTLPEKRQTEWRDWHPTRVAAK
jgi:hypothetical protein